MTEDERTMTRENRNQFTIIVNTREKVVVSPDGEVSFEEVVALAYDSPPSGPYIEFTIGYRNSAGRSPDGRLFPGQKVRIQDGTVFIVTFTDKS